MKGVCFLVVAMTLFLAACAPVAPKATAADRDPLRRAIVEDVADAMNRILETANTALVPSRPTTGAFGSALMAALRGKGFRVEAPTGRGEVFDCRVEPLDGSTYRLTVHVGKVELSRLWVLDGATAYAGGAWARRE